MYLILTLTKKTVEIQKKKLEGPLNLLFSHSHWYYDPDVFQDPMRFLPERWIPGDKDEISKFAKSTFKPFGGGLHL